MIKNKTHYLKCEITYDLMDMAGVLHHPKYLILCERARIDALELAGHPYPTMMESDYGLAVIEVHSEYLRAIKMSQKITVLTRTLHLSKVRINVEHTLIRSSLINPEGTSGFLDTHLVAIPENEILFRASMKMVSISTKTLKPIRFSEALFQSFNN